MNDEWWRGGGVQLQITENLLTSYVNDPLIRGPYGIQIQFQIIELGNQCIDQRLQNPFDFIYVDIWLFDDAIPMFQTKWNVYVAPSSESETNSKLKHMSGLNNNSR